MAKSKLLICPYCGETQPERESCRACGGLFEPLSRRATHNAMGPWFIRDPKRPFQPGCSYDTLVQLIQRGKVEKLTLVRGPTTRQFWTIAKRVPGIAHLFGYCHECSASVDAVDHACHACGVAFGAYLDRNYLGLPEIRPMPWETDPDDRSDGMQGLPSHGLGPSSPITSPFPNSGGRFSRFATDEELFGSARSGPEMDDEEAQRAAEAGALAVAVQTQEQPQAALQQVAARPSASVERSLRLMIAQQRQTIRRLTILVILITVGSATMLFLRPPVGFGRSVPPPTNAPMKSETSKAERPQPSAIKPPQREDSEDARAGDQPEIATVDIDREYERALDLMRVADDEANLLAERIRSCEEALEILLQIQRATADSVDRPARLNEVIELVRRQLDRLKLQEFFP
ncbi:MAG TPA: hypothetical protein PK400_12450 [Phycisphaerales bacterium]|nr:hypothetical protein [Phycisphaerales bacterium]HRQ76104.1 hypothetical protein [Phycisphaerales bacterium]